MGDVREGARVHEDGGLLHSLLSHGEKEANSVDVKGCYRGRCICVFLS